MIKAFLLGAAIVVAGLTELRGEASFGLTDLLVVGVALLCLFGPETRAEGASAKHIGVQQPIGYFERLTRNPISVFWILTLLLMTASTLINLQGGRLAGVDLNRQLLPFAATGLIAIASADAYSSRNQTQFLMGLICSSLVIFGIYAFAVLADIRSFYNVDGRFIGWSENPNQTGFQAVATLAIALSLFGSGLLSSVFQKALHHLLIVISFVVGIASQSDSFTLAAVPIVAYLFILICQKFTKNFVLAVGLLIFAASLFLSFIMVVHPNIIPDIVSRFIYNLQYGNQDADRITAWTNGFLAWMDSPIWGHGPGGWSGFSGPYEGVEAHNSYIDWMTIIGIPGILSYIILVAGIFKFSVATDLKRYVGLAAILIFGMFGFVLRLPIYWAAMVCVLTALHGQTVNGAERSWNRRSRLQAQQPSVAMQQP